MRKEFLDQYVLAICNHSMEPIRATRDEIQGLRKVLEEFPLDIEPEGEGHINYFPEGGTGSANIPHLIKIGSKNGIVRVSRQHSYSRKQPISPNKKVEFVHLSKCLCLKYSVNGTRYTFEIDV